MTATAQRRPQLDALAVTLLVACCLLWGLNQVVAKVALAQVPPLQQAGLRSLGAALLLALWSRARGVNLPWRGPTLAAGVGVGLLFSLEFAALFIGLAHTSASRMVVFLYTAPFFVALGMPFIQRGERLSAPQWAGLALAFLGVVAAFGDGLRAGAAGADRTWLGDALGLAAALLWASTTLTVRATRLSPASAELTLMYQLVVSGLLLTAASPLLGEAWLPWGQWRALTWALMGFQIVVITFASYLVWFWLVRHYPATQVSSFTLLTPLAGVAAGVALLGEPLTAQLAFAGAAVALGLWLVNRPRPAAAGTAR